MKPENKLPVLDLISAEMKTVEYSSAGFTALARNGNDC